MRKLTTCLVASALLVGCSIAPKDNLDVLCRDKVIEVASDFFGGADIDLHDSLVTLMNHQSISYDGIEYNYGSKRNGKPEILKKPVICSYNYRKNTVSIVIEKNGRAGNEFKLYKNIKVNG
ncbi:hypothetical protein [Vibrio crassostreae]|uniref:hypothetical protein n=1 Tax=Vibrio crassostreae TaxID=246167 RepID=UPI00104C1CBD|nr:hypothetical protein [Vibrio crassostreae]TCV29213.1 hypothetical protein EDB71_10483 [Vibrio crassostreae]CAK3139321.1 Lipoprotein [Vibrio crassostreae]CAK3153256.1 Lipoprotein [Vibrio crassostreae]CAK3302826.1 Lipoprotein [Vibrio crassostreae]CAK3644347.1 Lipoprotein [Vibrio crassostreae]